LSQKSEAPAQKMTPVGPVLLQWYVASKCFGNYLICWQLISVKAAKRLPGLPFQPNAGNTEQYLPSAQAESI